MRGVAGVLPLGLRWLRGAHPTTWAAALAVVAICVGAALYASNRLSSASFAKPADPWTREIAARVAKLPLVLTETPNRAKKEAREAVKQHRQARLAPEVVAAPPSPKPQPVALKADDPSRLGSTRRAGQDEAETDSGRQAPQDEAAPAETGRASWYALPGRTASGEQMNHAAMTAAHPSLPFGTKVRVVNLKNGSDVVVRINDRGPFAKNRIIDLSKAAAAKLGMINTGVARVSVHPVENELASNDDADGEVTPVAR